MAERDTLEEVRAAKSRLDSAGHEYRRAIMLAVDGLELDGERHPYAKVADAAGVTRQTVREIVGRARAAEAERRSA